MYKLKFYSVKKLNFQDNLILNMLEKRYLQKEYKKKFIFLCGKETYSQILPQIENHILYHKYDLGDAVYIPMRSLSWYYNFESDFRDLLDCIDFLEGKETKDFSFSFELFENSKDFEKFTGKHLVIDIETTGLNFIKDKIFLIGLCDENTKMIIPEEKLQEAKKDLLKLIKNKILVLHNGKFDCKFLTLFFQEKIFFNYDTMLMHYLIDERRGKHDLLTLSQKYFNEEDYEKDMKKSMRNKNDYYNVDRKEMYKYLAKDIVYTWKLFKLFSKKVDIKALKFMMKASKLLQNMEMRGIKFDRKYARELELTYNKKLDEMENDLTKLAIDSGFSFKEYQKFTGAKAEIVRFNLNSPKQINYFVYEVLKIKPISKAMNFDDLVRQELLKKYGCPQNMEEIIEWKNKNLIHRFLFDYCEYKKVHKLFTTYIVPMFEYTDVNNKIHSNYLLHGTVTGRLSSKDPNMQNIPSNAKDVKNVFIPSEGHVLIEADYSQAELRVLAVLSDDEFLKNVYFQEKDLHDAVTVEIYGENFTKAQRSQIKGLNFGIVYGRGAYSIANEYKISTKEAQQMIDKWMEKVPKAGEFIKKYRNMIRTSEVAKSVFGKQRRFYIITEDNKNKLENENCNFIIQSSSSDMTLSSGIVVDNILRKKSIGCVLNLIHDSILVECKEDKVEETIEVMRKVMETLPKLIFKTNMPFRASFEISNTGWGNKKKKT